MEQATKKVFENSPGPDAAAMLREGTRMVVSLMENATDPVRNLIERGLDSGCDLSFRLVVCPRPKFYIELREPEGTVHELWACDLPGKPHLNG